jgi:hypothetical protein
MPITALTLQIQAIRVPREPVPPQRSLIGRPEPCQTPTRDLSQPQVAESSAYSWRMVMRARAYSYVIGAISAAVGEEECPIPGSRRGIFRSRQIADSVRLSAIERAVITKHRSASSGPLLEDQMRVGMCTANCRRRLRLLRCLSVGESAAYRSARVAGAGRQMFLTPIGRQAILTA